MSALVCRTVNTWESHQIVIIVITGPDQPHGYIVAILCHDTVETVIKVENNKVIKEHLLW